jgi:hypothetical protein
MTLYCAKQTSRSRRIAIGGCRARNDTLICRDDAQAAVGDATCGVGGKGRMDVRNLRAGKELSKIGSCDAEV